MFKQTILIASAAAATMFAVPGAAQAQSYYGQPSYGYGYQPTYQYNYQGQRRAYRQQQRYYRQQQRYYGQQGYYGQRAYYGHRQRCGNGTTGLIVGGAAGALIGREVDRGGSRSRYYGNRGSGTTGAIIGGALGALVGREVARSC